MVRNLMLIIGVSLSLAAFGCSSDSGTGGTGGGGAGGDGGTAGSGGETGGGGSNGLPTDACTNSDDLALVCAPGWSDAVGECARAESGDPDGTTNCLVENSGISEACASCYGAATGCVLNNCIGECATAPDSEACNDCRVENGCDVLQDDCTGELDCPSGGGGAGGGGAGGAG